MINLNDDTHVFISVSEIFGSLNLDLHWRDERGAGFRRVTLSSFSSAAIDRPHKLTYDTTRHK